MVTINKRISNYNYSNRNGNKIQYIVLHYTGNNGDTANNNATYFNACNRNASAHYFVDDNEIIQVVEDYNASWHCGDGNGRYDITNRNSIGIEMCCAANGEVSERTEANALELTKELMSKYGISTNNVVRHYDASRKVCPNWSANNWERWVNFKSKLGDEAVISTTPQRQEESYTKKEFVKEIQRAIGANIDGIPGRETLSKTVTLSKSKNRHHAAVEPVQKYLNVLGFDCGVADGIAGNQFHNAVVAYQKANGLYVDGEITARNMTWKKLLGLA